MKQTSFEFSEPEQKTKQAAAIAAQRRWNAEPFIEYPQGKMLRPGDEVTLIHRTGKTRRVRFSGVVGPRIHVIWPVANDILELSVRTGSVMVPKGLAEWRLEKNALEMARVSRRFVLLEQKIAVE